MDFQDRLKKAAERGVRAKEDRTRQAEAVKRSEAAYRRMHLDFALQLSERIESCLNKLADTFPGFEFQTAMSDGWGGSVRRDDVHFEQGRRNNLFSRLTILVRPFSDLRVLDVQAKGTVHNKEIFSRHHYQHVDEVDLEFFQELIDLWVLEYAEEYAAAQ